MTLHTYKRLVAASLALMFAVKALAWNEMPLWLALGPLWMPGAVLAAFVVAGTAAVLAASLVYIAYIDVSDAFSRIKDFFKG